MVCRRWSELCYSSDLLRELAAHVRGHLWDQGPTVDQRLRRFFEWLLSSGAAQHVQRLEVRRLVLWWSPARSGWTSRSTAASHLDLPH